MSGNDVVHAFGDDALAEHDALGIAELIRAKALSRREVIEAAIARAEKVQPDLDAIRVADFERALEATARPAAGPFSGVPTFIKDNTDVAGLPTNQGSEAFTATRAKTDAPITRQLLGLGLVNLGKTTMPEFGLNASTEHMTEPDTRNPWNPRFSSGASSGGSAALVAAGVVPIAHANDGGGSIRIPAACCGLVGLKPTRGRFQAGTVDNLMPVKIVSEGVLTRSVRDTAHVYAGAELAWRPRALPPVGLVEGPSTRRLRIGLFLDSVTGATTDQPTRAAVTSAAELLTGLGHHVHEVPAPVNASFAEDFGIYWGLLAFLLMKAGPRAFGRDFDPGKLENLTTGLADHYRANRRATLGVIRRLRRSTAAYLRAFTSCDVLLSPVLAHTTPDIGHLSPRQPFPQHFQRLLDYVAFTPLNNATGSPAISLPMARTDDGLPIGVHFCARPGDERTLLELAFEIEEAAPWRRIHHS
ncbi:MAG TPA: amidase [Pseudonocardiaceae bacterium]|nr:amidase [Pseudonocardiaceae bacterium]